MQNKARNILQLKIQIRACIPYRDGSQPTILHSDHATVGPHGCFEIMLKMTGMIMTRIMIMIMSSSSYVLVFLETRETPPSWIKLLIFFPERKISKGFQKGTKEKWDANEAHTFCAGQAGSKSNNSLFQMKRKKSSLNICSFNQLIELRHFMDPSLKVGKIFTYILVTRNHIELLLIKAQICF